MILAVIDTNVLVSAFLARYGNEANLLRVVRGGLVVPCITEEIFDEYIEVLTRTKFGIPHHEIDELMALFRSTGLIVQAGEATFVSPDPKDTKFLQCASAALADFIVTGNRRHFPASPYASTHVVSAGEFLVRTAPKTPIST